MAAANESQGLKIAVAVFVTFTVVFAVTTYFAYSSYATATAKQAEAESASQKYQKEWTDAKNQFEYLKERAGYAKIEEFPNLQDQIKKDETRLKDQVARSHDAVRKMIDEYEKAGGTREKVIELRAAADQIVSQIQNEPNATYQSQLDRMTTLIDHLSQITTALVVDNEDLHGKLGQVDRINDDQLKVQRDAVAKSNEDLAKEHDTHEQERQTLLRRNDELSTKNAELSTQIARLNQVVDQLKVASQKTTNELTSQLRYYKASVEKKQEVMDVPDGHVQFVDYNRNEIRTEINRKQGARERLQLSVFDRNSPGLPTDKPKALVELIRVGDQGSVARIVRTNKTNDPIRNGDLLYSAAWSADRPERFALIGKIDMDRDGRDDRADLKRLIQAAGGSVEFDLPPPGVGNESGTLSGTLSWYVTDDREPIRQTFSKSSLKEMEQGNSNYIKRKSEVLREVDRLGVRPIAIERLLPMLGYQFGSSNPGRVEAIDRNLSNTLSRPVTTPVPAEPPPAGNATDPFASPPPAGDAGADPFANPTP